METLISSFQALYNKFDSAQRNFHGIDPITWERNHSEVPVFAVAIYLLIIFQVPKYLGQPLKLRPLNAVWNLCLAVFSMLGCYRTVPVLVNNLLNNGFRFTVCEDPFKWYSDSYVGFWVAAFIFSKIPELMDTVFLVLQKKEVIFLHWFHHITVLLYCWHAHHNAVAPGLWFASMNYTVHSIMYLYYFLGLIGYRKLIKPIAPFITSVQLLQMVGGMVVTGASFLYYHENADTCVVDPANMKLAIAMYFSYFVLFTILFYNLYISPKKGAIQTGCPDIAEVSDASGFFHSNNAAAKTSKKHN